MTRTYAVRLAELQAQPTAVVRGRATMDRIADFLGGAFGEVMSAAGAQGRRPVGPPFARYHIVEGDELDIEAGFPLDAPVAEIGRVVPAALPGGKVATTLHVGSYDDVGSAYDAATQFLTSEGYEVAGPPWESYLDEPDVPEPRTEVFLPCRRLRPGGVAQPEDGRSL